MFIFTAEKDVPVSQKRILIVEDEEGLLKFESILMRSHGYEVTEVSDGNAALECMERVKPDLVLLDIMIPGIDGIEVCRQIKSSESTRHIPVIMLTAKRSRDDMVKSQQVGADWYITKPFKSAMLIEAVQRFLS